MRDAEEVAREILDAMWERVGNEGFDEDATTPALVRIIRTRDAEVRAETLAGFEVEAAQRYARAYGDGYDAGLRARARRVP